jgi:hypothetical protein
VERISEVGTTSAITSNWGMLQQNKIWNVGTFFVTDILVKHVYTTVKHVFSFLLFQYFVFDYHMPPVMLFDKIITLSVSIHLLLFYFICCYFLVLITLK